MSGKCYSTLSPIVYSVSISARYFWISVASFTFSPLPSISAASSFKSGTSYCASLRWIAVTSLILTLPSPFASPRTGVGITPVQRGSSGKQRMTERRLRQLLASGYAVFYRHHIKRELVAGGVDQVRLFILFGMTASLNYRLVRIDRHPHVGIQAVSSQR